MSDAVTRRTQIAILEPAIYNRAPMHVASCHDCSWREERSRRIGAIRAGAAHVEEKGTHQVVVQAVAIDWILPVPDLPKYAARRILAPPMPKGKK